jgi:ABC-type lipoprotein export system ATPase subunit/GNAT superfamily N-acetyltransferase
LLYEKQFPVSLTNDSTDIADAFGVTDGWVNKIVDVRLPDTLPSITLITGESGCGKSTLMRMIEEPTAIEIPDTPLHKWAKTDEESLCLLNTVGLNDASLFALKYSQLSDSQQARARMYACLCNGVKRLIVDEFLATLDRNTAKVLAFSFQKILRKQGIALVAVTAQDDLIPYLQPDLIVRGRAFPSQWAVNERTTEIKNPFTVVVRQELGVSIKQTPGGLISPGKDAYRNHRLGEIHYKGKYTGGRQEYFSATIDSEIVGWLVGKMLPGTGGQYRIARVVVHPTYRGCGVGQALVRAYLKHRPDCDTLAAMAKFNPVFEKAGMRRVADVVIEPPPKLKKLIKLSPIEWATKSRCLSYMMDGDNREIVAPFSNFQYVNPGGARQLKLNYGIKDLQADVKNTPALAGTLLWNLRRKSMAKFVGPGTVDPNLGSRRISREPKRKKKFGE